MKTQSAAAIQAWLVSQLSEVLYVEPEEIDVREPFAYYGLSSSHAAIISGDLENWLGITLSPTALYEHPTIEALSGFLSGAESAAHAEVLPAEVVRGRETENEPIAIVGIGCRVPGAHGVEAFWELLRNGVDAISEVPADRWDVQEFYDPEPTTPGKMNTRWGGFLDRVDQFDPHLFGISPREAERMDPQQRLLMETAWEAFEDAGIAPAELRNSRTGVFVGISNNDYCHLQMSDARLVDAYAGTGNSLSIAANRLSYFFDLHGPSVTIDSACSSGLVAAHLACQSLRNGESTMALVGASNVMVSPEYTIIFAKAGLLAPDGRCKVFDARANGYVRGEGAGLVVLKPLSRAIADGDHVYACILGSAVNQDGRTNGLTSPSRQAQEAMLLEAYARAGVSPGEVQYVEAHGTGTELGDPIEAKALGAVLARDRRPDQPCAIGSVKSNIGHLEAAAGIAGLIKVALSLKHKEIPPSLHFQEPNPHIPFRELPLRVQQRLEPWPAVSGATLAGVSAFGFGGTNAHVVLAEAPVEAATNDSKPWQFLTLSAKTESALEQATENLAQHLKEHPELNLADVAYTLQKGRNAFNHRRVVVCRSTDDAVTKLETLAPASVFTKTQEATNRPVTFVLSGVGDHYEGMARGLYQNEKVFKEEVDRCCELLMPLLGTDLRQLIFSDNSQQKTDTGSTNTLNLREMLRRAEQTNSTTSELHQTRLAQPAVFVIEYALAQLLQHWGVRPQQLIGYSLGEYVAACLSGVFSLEDALKVVAQRAALIEEVSRGAMLAVSLSEAELKPLLSEGASISIINGERMCIVGGEVAAIEELEQRLTAQEIASRRLPTEHAFHTAMMEEVSERFAEALKQVSLRAPQIPVLSNVTGRVLSAEEATDPQYWVRHMCQTVRFADGLAELLKEENGVLIEIGCGQSLSSFVKQHGKYAESTDRVVISTIRHEWERFSDEEVLSTAIGKLWLSGVEVEWEKYYEGEERRKVQLPTYPFERQRYWIETEKSVAPLRKRSVSSEAKAAIDDWFFVPKWIEADLSGRADAIAPVGRKRCWLLFADDSTAPQIEDRLRQQGDEVITVEAGEEFGQKEAERYSIRAGNKADYDALFKELRSRGQALDTIVHLWTSEAAEGREPRQDSFEQALEKGFNSLLFIAQALGDNYSSDKIQLAVVSSNVQKVTGTEALCPEKATILGPCRVIPQEYANVTCRNIDVAASNAEESVEPEQMAARIIAELTGDSSDQFVALRGSRRWVQTVERLQMPSTADSNARLRPEGVYLITGGLGGIGFGLAEYLGRTLKARLVLTSRKALPPREQWEQWLVEKDSEDATSRLIRGILALEEDGAEVLALSADVTSLEQMQQVVRLTEERFGTIHGVIHAAGLPGAGLIQLKTPEMAARILAPKVKGALVLDSVLQDRQLDFLVLFSSIVSMVGGGPGQVDYCAANSFLDAFAQANATRFGITISIDWAEWQWNAWSEGLSGFSPELQTYLIENRSKYGLTIEEGAESLRRILALNLPQVVVSTRSFNAWAEDIKTFTGAGALSAAEQIRPSRSAHKRPVMGTAYVPVTNETERKIAEVWQKALGIDHVGIHDRFFDLGGTSLIGLQVISELKKALDVELPTVALYEAPTVSALANYINPDVTHRESSARTKLEERRRASRERGTPSGIAIIGMAGRFPGAKNVEQLWGNLLQGAETVTFFSDEELKAAGVETSALNDPRYVKAGSVLEDIEWFDAALFGYSPREAEVMDPQHRMFLECAWEALENAGYDSDRYEGAIGVFGGSNISTYLLNLYADAEVYKSLNPMQTVLGNANDSLTTKVSYKLNLRGPSVAVQTFCSTSAVAMHMACQSLLQGSCDMALAGGVRIAVPHRVGYFYETGGIDSPDGHCRAFDAKAQGAVLGNGAGIVLLKKLEDALADGDHIYAVIKSSAINNDGSSKVGYTAPSVEGQASVIAESVSKAGIDPDSISYIEAHGTGTELGDPIEIAALTKAFRTWTDEKNFCAIGSVKTNFGHLDRAAGVTSLIKTALSLKHEVLPPSLHYNEPNPKIGFEESPFYVNTELREWKRNGSPRRAGVNALGIGGTNVHFILEESPAATPSGPSRPWQTLMLSANTETALETATDNLVQYLNSHPAVDFADVAYTLQVGRRRFNHRRMLVCRNREDAISALETRDARRVLSYYQEPKSRPVTFMLSGVGDHYEGMARGLYQNEKIFKEEVDRCCELLMPLLGTDLRQLIFSDDSQQKTDTGSTNTLNLREMLRRAEQTNSTTSELHQTRLAQPAVFVIEYALSQLLQHWGIRPQQLIGYSLGEYVAACLSGVFSLEDALKVVAQRAALIEEVSRGAMLAVSLSEAELQPLLSEGASISIINGERMCVVGGEVSAIEELEQRLTAQEIASRRLPTEHAFHTEMMQEVSERFAEVLAGISLQAPQIPVLSNVTGKLLSAEEATDAEYWVRHMCQTVRFSDGIAQVLKEESAVIVEVGCGQSLSSFVKQHGKYAESTERVVVSTIRHEWERAADEEVLSGAIGKLWLSGVEVEWEKYYEDEKRSRIQLPTYPFERQRYWIETSQNGRNSHAQLSLKGKRPDIADWFYKPLWAKAPLGGKPQSFRDEKSCWLIFSDVCGVGARLAERLKADGCDVITAIAGERFSRLNDDTYTLKADSAGDYEEMVRELRERGRVPSKVAHLWSLTPARHQSLNELQGGEISGLFDELQKSGFYSLLFFAKALAAQRIISPLRIEVVSNNLQAVDSLEELCPEKATLLGICKVIPQEFPNVTCRSIDLPAIEAGIVEEGLLDKLLAELTSDSNDLVVCYRDGERYRESFEALRLEPASGNPQRLRDGGVYLITGGLGGVGFALAQYLARNVRAKLVLTGRTALPERADWEQWLKTHADEDDISRKIRKVQALEELGAEVLVQSADVADEQQMLEAIRGAFEKFGRLHGVIHGAGDVSLDSLRAIQQIDKHGCERHFRPKVQGLLVLEKLLRDAELDFFFLLSSLSSVLGGIGFVSYAASNIFMDSFAHAQNRKGRTRWMTVNWDTWDVREEEKRQEVKEKGLETTVAEFAMSAAEGVEAFSRVLATDLTTHVVHSTGDLESRLDQWIRRKSLEQASETKSTRKVSLYARPNLQTAYVPVNNEVERKIAEVYQRVLGIEKVGLHDNYFDLGGTSLSAIQVVSELQKEFDAQISPITLFEAPTVSELAKHLAPTTGEDKSTDALKLRIERRQNSRNGATHADIAIIGMTGRFPGAKNIDELWLNLRNGVESISIFSDEELKQSGIEPSVFTKPNYVRARPIIEDTELFDASFFGYSPREAEFMDPQHRLFLESASDVLESAGYDSQQYDGAIGVFGGTNISSYGISLMSDPEVAANFVTLEGVIAHDKDSLTTSVSYKLNLKGPSFAVQTFCSTSLVALHLACRSILNGECDMAMAGGVSVRVPQKYGYLFDPGGQDSPDGHTRAFDARAKGTIFGDGVAIVLLKRLDDAIADGDTIHAVIKGSAINNDGSLKVGYTAPSVEAQAEVVALALANSGVEPSSISYVEAHGSATELGDPIELAALTKAFRLSTDEKGYCAVGSVKTNVGHLDRAAGVTGLIKTVEALKHKLLPPSLHYESPNPNIDFDNSPFFVNSELREWKRNGTPRRAGVNSLGVGGTNVHVVLEEAPAQAESSESREWQMLLLSAKSESALEKMTENLCERLKQGREDEKLADVAYTLQVGRRRHNHRRAVVCRNREEAISALESRDARKVLTYYQEPKSRPVTFMLSGVGDHYEGMARGLYRSERVFREEVDRCCELLKPLIGTDLRQLIFTDNSQQKTGTNSSGTTQSLRQMLARAEQTNSATSELHQTRLAQPAVFVIEYALSQLLQYWGVRPQQLIGYSLGEYVAACLSGVFSLEDALKVVARRAALIEEVGQGAMLAVSLSEAELKPLLSEGLSISIINGERMCVVGGEVSAIEELEQRLTAQEIASRRLPTEHAFHTEMMEQVSERFLSVLEQVSMNAPQIPVLSNVTGQLLTEAEATDPQYWIRHMCQTVRFSDAVAEMLKQAAGIVVEVGCGQSLSSFVKQHGKYAESQERVVIGTLRHEWEQIADEQVLSAAIGKLWLSGVEVEWEKYYEEERRRRVQLPTYPFERQRYWIDAKPRAAAGAKRPQSQDDLERIPKLDDWFYVPVWKQSVPLVPTESEAQEDVAWMVMTDGSSLASRLIEQLEASSADVISVGVSEQFDKIGESSYAINPRKRGDYDLLLRALEERGRIPNRIIHLWNVASYEDASSAIELAQETLDLGFYALMFLTQALGDFGVDETSIITVSSEMQKVTGDENLCPAKATLLGPSIVIPCEYTNITCRSIDIVVPQPDGEQEEELVQQLMTEFRHQCKDIIIAYRGEKRWEQTFDPLPLAPLTTPPSAPPPRIRTGGTYLITGGVGGIGLAMAEHLARTAQANLILISRSGLPERGLWQQLLADEQTPSSLAQKIAQVQALEELGAEVLVLSADVGDEAQMREVVCRGEERFGPIDGVIHAAGVPGAGLIQLKTEEVAASVLRPKVEGTLVLDEVFKDRSLDFLLLFSSMTSIVGGGPGQLDYCAANAFLDAFALKNNSRHRPVFAINWGEWQWDAWQEGLLGFDAKIAAVFKENRRRFGVSFEEGLDAMSRVLATRLPQVVVSTRDFKLLIELSKEFTVSGILSEADRKGAPGQAYPRPALGTSYVAPSTEVERTIAVIWQELLRIEQVGINDNFFELGGNSLLGITLVGQMKKRLKVEMPMYALYEAPTVSAMAKFIDKDTKDDQSLDERRDRGEMRRKRQQQRRADTRGELSIR